MEKQSMMQPGASFMRTMYKARAAAMSTALCLLASLANADTPAVCPAGSEGDKAFSAANTKECTWVINDHSKLPALNQTVDYNIYCPGRMSQDQANATGQALVRGAQFRESPSQPPATPNIILKQHQAASLAPHWEATPHVFHYNCTISQKAAVATHIKVRVKAQLTDMARSQRVQEVAKSCTFKGSQNGDIAIGARMDREYHCANMLGSDEREIAKDVAHVLVRRDLLGDARKIGGQVCLLKSTDIQCAPCAKSDKLIVRLKTVKTGDSCGAATELWRSAIR